jgi:gamma-glutamyl hydrolase
LQSYGCHIIYIDPRLNIDELKLIFNQTDGFLIPGGDEFPYDDNITYNASKIFFELAIQHRNYPILGICMGLHFMINYFSKENWDSIKTIVNNTGTQSKLLLQANKIENSILKYIPIDYYNYNFFNLNHNHAISYDYFNKNRNLNKNFNVLTISKCKENKYTFVSTIQSKIYPFFGFQWHPEKAHYEWSPFQNINRDPQSVIVGNIVSSFFIEYCILTNSITEHILMSKYDINNLKTEIFASSEYQKNENYDDPLVIYVLD